MKRLLALLLCLVMCVSLIPAAAAEHSFQPFVQEETDGTVLKISTGSNRVETFSSAGAMKDAISIYTGKTYHGELTDKKSVIFYSFELKKSGWLHLDATADNSKIHYIVYDSRGEELFSLTSQMNQTMGTNKADQSIALTKGAYFFAASREYRNSGSGTNGAYSFRLDFTDAKESMNDTGDNNSISKASSISVKKNYRGFLAENDSRDFFRFKLTESGWIRLKATAENSKIHYIIYNSKGEKLFETTSSENQTTGKNKTDQYLALTKGTYYLEVSREYRNGGSGTDGAFSFRIGYTNVKESYNDVGSNNNVSKASSISLNKVYRGFLAENDSVDYYRFSVSRSGSFRLVSDANNSKIYYYIYDKNGKKLFSTFSSRNETTGKNKTDETITLSEGTYYFAASREYGGVGGSGVNGSYSFYILEPNAKKPSITSSPKSVSAVEGEDVKFQVKASGKGLTYQWYYRESNSSKWKKTTLPGATTSTLTVYAKPSRSGFQYYCKVTNAVGRSYSKHAVLTVTANKIITSSPASKTVKQGGKATFKVSARNAKSYQWYYRTGRDGSWKETTLPGATTATLSVTGRSTRNGFQYRCKVTTEQGYYAYSGIATLKVKKTSTGAGGSSGTDSYSSDLLKTIAACDSRIKLPPESALYAKDKVLTKYVQGTYGQGIKLMSAPENGDVLGILAEGTRLTVYGAQASRGLVKTEDGRYGWAILDRMVDRFDPQLSYQRKRDYLVARPDEWTKSEWYDFIIDHADDLPAEVVDAATDDDYFVGITPLSDGNYYGKFIFAESRHGNNLIAFDMLRIVGEDPLGNYVFEETGETCGLKISSNCIICDSSKLDEDWSIIETYYSDLGSLINEYGPFMILKITVYHNEIIYIDKFYIAE